MPRQLLSDDERDQLISLVRGGAPLEACVIHIGQEPAKFFRWLERPKQRAFREQIWRAGAQANLADLGIIQGAEDWQAARVRLQLRQASEREQDLYRLNAIATGRT